MLKYKVLPYIEPEQVFVRVANIPDVIFLDSSQIHKHYGRYSFILLNPLMKYIGTPDSFNEDLIKWDQLLHSNQIQSDPNLPPFGGGLAGYFSYDLSKQLENIPSCTSSAGSIVADYTIGLYNQVLAFDHIKKLCYAMVAEVEGYTLDFAAQLDNIINLYHQAQPVSDSITLPQIILRSNYTKTEYMAKVSEARELILNGDIFEVNISQRFSGTITPDYPLSLLYRKLRNLNSAPFSAYLNLGNLCILSASPERFVSVVNRHIETRPIKGTCLRSSNKKEDKRRALRLRHSSKDRAENIMIVDLMRNDLGKICDPKSIDVTTLCGVESFINVHHLVSVIEGDLNPDKSIFDVIPACFPGGSITGAPKIRAMQIIEELEGISRGVYCGSIGYFGFNGNVDLSIAIRTVVCHNNELSFHVGGAVTFDSDPAAEYNETLIKGQKLIEAINS